MSVKICILTTIHSVFDVRIFHKEAKTLVQAGYDVTLIVQHDKNEIVDGVNIIALPRPRSRFRRFFGLTWQAFRLALHQRADVYHFHDPELLPIGILLKLFTHAKVIYDVHEDYRQIIRLKYWLPKPIRGFVANLVGYVEVIGGSIFDAVITVTEFIQVRFPSDKVVVIKNYPLLDLEGNDSNPARSGSGIKLVYVGGLNRGRGIYEMIKAMAYLDRRRKVRLRLLGRFDELDELNTDKKICTLPGFKQTELVGWIPHPKVYDYLHTSHIGLVCLHPVGGYPLGLPVKLFEYMAAGLPVIASEFPLWKEIIEGNRCGLTVDPLNPRGIAKAIEYLIKHPELRQEMGANGRQAVQEKYNWGQESKKLLNLYTKLTTARRDTPYVP
ncbi:MAG: glycosyltransferase family 4 protein [Desulfosporosinus sp.]|nr:glycosyltransferase family 4 protein [Desulfosporosinus sp.]